MTDVTLGVGEGMHPMFNAAGAHVGEIFADFIHDSDPCCEFYGRCDCGWHDTDDHVDIHTAEQVLLDHVAGHTAQ
jgi:hypothetical protein